MPTSTITKSRTCPTCGLVFAIIDKRQASLKKYCGKECRENSPARKRYLANYRASPKRKQYLVDWKARGGAETLKRWREVNRVKLSADKKANAEQAREEGLAHYGGKCVCCGESRVEFLTMEHKNGRDPSATRLTGKRAWANARSKGWPQDITILCFNCNCAKGALGYCPHERERREPNGQHD